MSAAMGWSSWNAFRVDITEQKVLALFLNPGHAALGFDDARQLAVDRSPMLAARRAGLDIAGLTSRLALRYAGASAIAATIALAAPPPRG